MIITFKPPFTRPLLIDCNYGSGQLPPSSYILKNEANSLTRLYDEMIIKKNDGRLTDGDLYEFVTSSLGLDKYDIEERI
jgi:hypothetical protein